MSTTDATSGCEDFWLRQFVQERTEANERPPDSDFETASAYKSAHGESTSCGITTSSHEGVVDTAAEGGLIGSIALKRFCHALSQRGSGPQNNLQQKELVVVLRCWESHCFQSAWAARTGC